MDAERAVPAECPEFGEWVQYQCELGGEFCGGVDILADDGVSDAGVDVCCLCCCLFWGVGGGLVDLSRDYGVGVGGGGEVA